MRRSRPPDKTDRHNVLPAFRGFGIDYNNIGFRVVMLDQRTNIDARALASDQGRDTNFKRIIEKTI